MEGRWRGAQACSKGQNLCLLNWGEVVGAVEGVWAQAGQISSVLQKDGSWVEEGLLGGLG